jgi:hypothetical protein
MKKIILFIVLIFQLLNGKVLLPQEDGIVEFLAVKENLREYYKLNNNSYLVSGPSFITVYARLAVPRNENGPYVFSINYFLSEVSKLEPIHNFEKRIDSSVSSALHPMHRYTKPAKIEIKIPKGDYVLSINNESDVSKPILMRVVQKRRKI